MKIKYLLAALAIAAISCTGVTPEDDNPDKPGVEQPDNPDNPNPDDPNPDDPDPDNPNPDNPTPDNPNPDDPTPDDPNPDNPNPDNPNPDTPQAPDYSWLKNNDSEGLTLSLSANIAQVGVDTIFFVVRFDGKLLDGGYKIYENGSTTEFKLPSRKIMSVEGSLLDVPYWVPDAVCTKSFWLTYKTSNTKKTPVSITVIDRSIPARLPDPQPDNTSFKKRAFVIDFTGTSCGFCPYFIAAIDHLIDNEGAEFSDKAVVAEVHTYNDYSPLKPSQAINTYLGVTTYPTVVVNLTSSYGNWGYDGNVLNLSKALNTQLSTPAQAGISAVYEMSGNTLLARVTVKAAETGEYRVGLWVLEDKIYAKQTNNGMKEAFEGQFDNHNDVLRYADSVYSAGNYSGCDLGVVNKGEYVDYVFVTHIDETWNKENCHLAFFVTTSDGRQVAVANAVRSSSLSGSFAFEYE